MKVAYLYGTGASLDGVRGIGVHNRELVNAIKDIFSESVKVVDNIYEADIVHITKFNPFFISIPFKKPAKKVVLTIHDLIPLIYPKHYPAGIRGKINFIINKFLIWKNVDAIITISETSKMNICRFLGVSPDKVFVTYLGVKKIYKKIKSPKYEGLPKKFALYIGDVNYNKNIPNLVKACHQSKIPLVIVGKHAKEVSEALEINTLNGPLDFLRYFLGKPHPEVAHYKQLLNLFNEKVIRLGYIQDQDLVKIVNLATVYIQPSFYEGFGLSPLEALACGVPVVASKTQCLVEVLGDAATYFDPNNISDMASKIMKPSKSGSLPREYTWEKCASKTVEVYKELLHV